MGMPAEGISLPLCYTCAPTAAANAWRRLHDARHLHPFILFGSADNSCHVCTQAMTLCRIFSTISARASAPALVLQAVLCQAWRPGPCSCH